VFIAERHALEHQSICGVCSVWSPKSGQVHVKIMDLVDTQLLLASESAVSRGTPMTQGLALYQTCDRGLTCAACKSCAGDLHRSIVPNFALSSKWNMGVVPAELLGLTVLEQLLVMRQFHVMLVLTVYGSVGGGDLPDMNCYSGCVCPQGKSPP
jgi:hypothetical protein